MMNKMNWESSNSARQRLVGLSRRSAICLAICAACLLTTAGRARAQVSPAEILNPQLKAAESKYLHQLQAYNRDVQQIKFPFPFYLTRYVNEDPAKQVATDTRGLEFVKFHDKVVLKITGVYAAAYDSARLTQNERASRTFTDVIAPILEILPKEIPADVTCDAIGFEISYHVRSRNKNFDYEGRENLVLVFDKTDAFRYSALTSESQRQDALNHSEIYLNGKEFGLALGQKEPFNVEALDRSTSHLPPEREVSPNSTRPSAHGHASTLDNDLPLGYHIPEGKPGEELTDTGNSPATPNATEASPSGSATQADADRLQAKYQAQLDSLAKDGASQFHLVDYAPPSFVAIRGKIFMQVTLRNPNEFDKDSTSIYKRAAQSFDLFLAPQLRPLLDKLPQDASLEGLDITLLNELAAKPKASSEALEFVCPLKPLRQFVDAEITNQDLINRSAVLVNGVRIALDLQKVE